MHRFCVVGAVLVSCSAPPRPAATTSEPVVVPAVVEDAGPPVVAAPEPIPTACATNDGVCLPDSDYVSKLCNGNYPDVALLLMGKNSPFSHMYMRGDVDGWNADGGISTRARLVFDEEMLVLKKRAPPTKGIVVGSGGGYLVLRWDGNCYTLEDSELTARKPPSPKHAPIPWRFYSERTREALLKSPKVAAAVQRRGKECKGATHGDVTAACEHADHALSAAVVAEVRGGLVIPEPDRRP